MAHLNSVQPFENPPSFAPSRPTFDPVRSSEILLETLLDETYLRKMIATMDLTTLAGDDTTARVTILCEKARTYGVAAVCIYPAFVPLARRLLEGSGVAVATVSAGFPHGLTTFESAVFEVEQCAAAGADDIDIVIPRCLALEDRWEELYQTLKAYKQAAGRAHLKAILATGELGSLERVYRASWVALLAGSDFIKTSTGKESVNATPEVAAVMLTALTDYRAKTGITAGFKPAGGIRTAEDAAAYLTLAEQITGPEFVHPATFRLGASSLLDDVLNRLA
jgi:deoxyribose-phosphate aldolase